MRKIIIDTKLKIKNFDELIALLKELQAVIEKLAAFQLDLDIKTGDYYQNIKKALSEVKATNDLVL